MEMLNLLMIGKANKDIAHELGIGVGTVKQHMVALFKKLNVSSRAMAISRGHSLEERQPPKRSLAGNPMELCPATVLSLALEMDAGDAEDAERRQALWQEL